MIPKKRKLRAGSAATGRAARSNQEQGRGAKLSRGKSPEHNTPGFEILDALTAQIAVLDATGEIVRANKAWQTFAEQNAASDARADVGSNYLELCRREAEKDARGGARETLDAIQAVMQGTRAEASIESFLDSTGLKQWFRTNVARLPGKPTGQVVISREDITAYKNVAEKLRTIQERPYQVAATAPHIVWTMNRDSIVTSLEGAPLAGLGIDPKQVIGHSAWESMAREPEAQAYVRRALDGETITARVAFGDLIFDARFEPIKNVQEETIGVVCIAVENTRLAHAEQELSASEARWRSTVESVPVVVTTLDPAGTILSLNRKLGRFSPEQLIGRNVLEFVSPERLDESSRKLKRVFEQKEAVSYELETPSALGEPLWLHINLGPVIVGDRVDAAVAVIMDTTKEKQQSLALRQARDELEQRVLERTADLSRASAELERIAAEQAALAAENARLYRSSRQQYDIAETLNEVALVLSSTLDSNVVLDGILAQARRFVPFDTANVMLIQDDMAGIVRAIGYDEFGLANPERIELVIEESPFLAQVLKTSEPVIVEDIRTVPDWIPLPETDWMRGYACVPMRAQGEIFGFLNVDSAACGSFTPEHVRLLQALATLGAIALNNARLYETARSSAQELQSLSHSLVQRQEDERRRISRELHDGIGQAVTSQLVDLHFMEKHLDDPESLAVRIHDLKLAANGVLEELHRQIMNLHPAVLDHLGFTASVGQYVEAFQRQHPELDVDCSVVGLGTQRLPREMEVALYRIVQESLTNIARHAHATKVEVAVTKQAHRIAIVIWDDGVGFVPEAVMGSGRLGLAGMRERAKMLGGTLEISSAPNQGTTIQVEVVYGN